MTGDTQQQYRQIMVYLRRLCSEGATGTLFVKTQDNRSAQIALQDGEIVGCAYRANKGGSAIPLIRNMMPVSYSFSEGLALGAHKAPLPDTPTTLQQLEPEDRGGPSSAQAPSVEPARVESVPTAERTLVASALVNPAGSRSALVENIETLLHQFIGPMATILCDEYRYGQRSVTSADLMQIVEELAGEIESPTERARFVAAASERLDLAIKLV
jgi:hypothetical protein